MQESDARGVDILLLQTLTQNTESHRLRADVKETAVSQAREGAAVLTPG